MSILGRVIDRGSFRLIAVAIFLALGASAMAVTYTVGTTTDFPITTVNSANGQIVSGTGAGQVTLRSAVIAANQSGVGPHIVNVPAGTYNLSQTNPNTPGTTATAGLNDLQVGSNLSTVTVQGTGVTPKIVQTVAGNDVFTTGLNANSTPAVVSLTLSNLEITGGTFTGIFVGADDGTHRSSTIITNCNIHNNTNSDATFGQGGAIQNDVGSLSVTGTTFTSNSASNANTGQGGAIFFSLPNASGTGSIGTLTVSGCTFTSNTAAVKSGFPGGGAIFVGVISPDSAGGAINISSNTFTGNQGTGGGDGGAIASADAASRTLNINRNYFTTNAVTNASGHGGALHVQGGTVNLNFNRLIANTATTTANGRTVNHTAANSDPVSAADNWWGVNTGPVANDIAGTVSAATWLQLRASVSPTTIFTNQAPTSTTVTADIFGRNSGGATAASNLSGLPSFPVPPATIFSNPAKGSLSALSTQFTSGQATGTFTAGAVGGVGGVDTVADSQTVTVTFAIDQPPSFTSAASTTFTAGVAGTFNITTAGYPNVTVSLNSGTFPSGVVFGVSQFAGTPALSSYGTYPLTFGASNGVTPTATQNFTLIVNPSPQDVKSKTVITRAANGTVTANFVGNPGQQYTVQFASALGSPTNWQFLSFQTAGANGTFPITDNPPAGTPARFYRAIVP